MRDLPSNLIIEKNKTNTSSAWLLMLEVLLTDGNILRFVRNTEDIYYHTEECDDVGLLAHYKLNDNADSNAVADSSGNGHNGTVSNDENNYSSEQYNASGKINGCFDFDGTNDYVTVPDDSSLNFGTSQDFSISVWFKTSNLVDYTMIVEKRGAFDGYFISGRTSDKIEFEIHDGTNNVNIYSDETLEDGSWHHVVVVADRSNLMKMYVDGVLQNDTGDISSLGDISNDDDLYIGQSGGGSHRWNGSLDDIRIYNKVLTIDEVAAIYNSGNGTENVPALYSAVAFQLEPGKLNAKGEIPNYTLRVGNVTRLLQPYIQSLNGGNGSTVRITVVNSNNLGEDYAELKTTCDVLACHTTAEWVVFTLGAPNPLRRRFPLDRYLAQHCRWRFRSVECGYGDKAVAGVTLSGSNPVSINVTSHGFSTGDVIQLAGIAGITSTVDGDYTITKTDADNFTLDGTDSSNYSGSYTSGGTAGYSSCKRILSDCRDRENATRFGGFVGMRTGSVRIA